MKKIFSSVILLVSGVLLLVWFSKTDQAQAGLILGLDGSVDQFAHGAPFLIGWTGIFALLGAFVLFCFGISQIREDKQEKSNSDCQDRSDRWHRDRTASYMAGDPNDPSRPKGFGRPENYKPCD